jgi:predicted ArsR family transcriptional regulator
MAPMSRNDIPEEVLRFIERRIDSVPHMEALLLLWEAPARQWSDAEIAARVYVSSEQARKVLTDLARSGLIDQSAPAGFVYNCAWDESNLMKKVAAAYRRHLVHVSGLIHAKSASEAVRDFARAFQFKPED